jgi:GNAT superfamily N-acetyltransferase
MEIYESRRGNFLISTDPSMLQINVIHHFLSVDSYWAQGRSIETVAASIQHSLCFGVYAADQQVGFARVVTDYTTFAWLCDVFIQEDQRGQGLGKWLIQTLVAHPDLISIKRILLATRDAHELYRRYGDFKPLPEPERWMTRMNLMA